ncbi:MAG: type II toxin-antitoxin system death-on-curing family toxin [Acidobacteriaceae bacterium]
MNPRARRWQWIEPTVLHAIHDRLIEEHGGLGGVRDQAMIESALARPQHLFAYGKPDAADLAAAYAFGLARNHGFVDGNKRVAWTIARLFLARNGLQLKFQAIDAIVAVERLAAGVISQDEFAQWLRARLNA